MAKRKWAQHVKGLPPETALEEVSYGQLVELQIEELKREVNCDDPAEVARKYAELRREEEQIDGQHKAINLKVEAAERVVARLFPEKEISSIDLDGIGKVSHSQEPVGNVDDRIKFRLWCEDNGHRDELTLHWQTMNSIVKTMMEGGQPLPDGVTVYVRDKVSFSKAKSS